MPSDRSALDDDIGRHLSAARRGEEPGFSGLYTCLAGRVAGYVRSRGVHDVDDVVNDVFLAAFANLTTFEGDAAGFRSWVFGIAWNKTADWHRAAARRPPVVDDPSEHLDGIEGGDAEQEAIGALSNVAVEEMLRGLTDEQRDVLLLRIVAGLSLAETATALAKPVGAVKSLQHRALGALQRNISPPAVSPPTTPPTTGAR